MLKEFSPLDWAKLIGSIDLEINYKSYWALYINILIHEPVCTNINTKDMT